MGLTPKERFLRGFDALGAALPEYVHSRMQSMAGNRPWFPIHQALEEKRGRFTKNMDPRDPREMVTVLQRYANAFPEITEEGRRSLRQLRQIVNSAAHSTELSDDQVKAGLDLCLSVAGMLGLDEPARQIRAIQESGRPTARLAAAPSPGEQEGSGDTAPAGASPSAPDIRTNVEVEDRAGLVSFESDEYSVRIQFLPALNFALVHNSVSVLSDVSVKNTSDAQLRQVELRLTLVGLGDGETSGFEEKVIAVPTVPAGADHVVETRDLLWHIPDSLFAAATEAWNIELRASLSVGGEQQGVQSAPLVVHPANEWWMSNTGEALSSFIRPNEEFISELLSRVSDELYRATGDPALHGYQRGPERVRETAKAAYRVLVDASIDYVEAPPSFRVGSQRIRGHQEVVEKKLGTCLDLAVLYAAILEAAGIAPVLVLGKSHAFTGYLLEDTQLSESFVTAPSALHTIAQSNIFESVELTGVTGRDGALTFEQGRQAADSWWPNRIDDVEGLIDVRAAHRWFRPLPTLSERDGVLVIERVVEAPARKRAADSETVSYSRVSESVPQRVGRWKKSLLDLSFRNPLLKIKRPSSIPLLMPPRGMGLLEDRVSDDRTIALRPDSGIRTHSQAKVDLSDVAVQESLLQEIAQGDTAFTDLSESMLQRRVTSLRRRAKESREETGADSLYLTLGVLEWKEGTTTGAAPVFLLPISLRGGRKGERVTFVFDHSREFEPNFCLYEKLKGSYSIELPELLDPGADSFGIDLEGAFSQIRTRLTKAGASQFSLQEDAFISTFQFSTLTMWRDLDENWNQLTKSAPVRHLVENSGDSSPLGIEPAEMEEKLSETEAYAPLPVDSAQLAAIDLAAQGASFVLEGPPGTGKSQTITNMIAHALARGQKVLFVAEKQAALEVVQRRLESVGLGKFILELHGEQQTRSSVREHLQASLDAEWVRGQDFKRAERTYKRSVDYLNDYARKVHVEGSSGMSLWTAHQAVLGAAHIGNQDQEPVELSRRLVLQESSAQGLQKLAAEVEQAMLDLDGLPTDSPWTIMDDAAELSEADFQLVERSVTALSQLLNQLTVDQLALMGALGSKEESDAVLQWVEAKIHGLAVDPETAFKAKSSWLAGIGLQMDQLEQQAAGDNPLKLGFTNDVFKLDLNDLHAQSVDADSKMFGKKKKRATILEQLQSVAPQRSVDPESLTQLLAHLLGLRDHNQRWGEFLRNQTGLPVEPNFLIYDQGSLDSLRGQALGWEVSGELGQLLQEKAQLRESLQAVQSASHADLAILKSFAEAWWGLRDALGVSPGSETRWLDGRAWRVALRESLEEWLTDVHLGLRGLRSYARAAGLLSNMRDRGVDDFSDRVWSGEIDAADIADEMDRAIYGAIRAERMQAERLQNFDPGQRELMAARFIENGEEYRRAIESTIAERLLSSRAEQLDRNMERELRSQLGRRRNAMSVRKLMAEYFPAISAITPCFLMSPSSVAKFLPPENELFDLVIFDEASQIRVPQAIGAMGRGKSVVIVGDSQQMPPSSMFMTRSEEADEPEEETEDAAVVPVDMESILSEAVESNFDRKMLLWHYRSRNESLIAFSNSRYYEDRLASFPSPPRITDSPQRAVSLVRVDGKWEGGSRAARVNQVEADAIVSAVVEQLETDPDKSIGVITFNIQQRNLILDLLEQRAASSRALAEALAQVEAPLFVKNLENVQGDERDVVFFSLAFSPDEHGRIPLNWGPLSRSGGEKRLNVAVTRAKEIVKVFSSFEPREFDLGASRSVGLKHLREYLLQAEDAQLLTRPNLAGYTDPHHEEVFDALKASGLQVRQRIGLSDFVLDLAVAVPGQRWLGILLEGPDWYERFSVSDREGLPRDVLTNQMGWAAIRTLSLPEWIKDKDGVVASIVEEAKSLPLLNGDQPTTAKLPAANTLRPETAEASVVPEARPSAPEVSVGEVESASVYPKGDQPDSPSEEGAGATLSENSLENELAPIRSAVQAEQPVSASVLGRAEHAESIPQVSRIGEGGPLPFVAADKSVRHERRILDESPIQSGRLLREEASDIVEQEGPVSEGRLLSILGQRFDLQRLQGRRREQLRGQLPPQLARENALGEVFYWPQGVEPEDYVSYREQGDRGTSDISFEELVNAMRSVLSKDPHLPEDEVLSQTRRIFGIGRLGAQIKPRFDGAYRVVTQHEWLAQNLVRGGCFFPQGIEPEE